MSNPFAAHGIDHLSPSSINLWVAAPALWVMERLLGRRTPPGVAAHRGTAVEQGVAAGLFDPALPVEDAQKIALQSFDRLTALQPSPKRDDERKAIPAMVETALAELRQYGVPDVPAGGPGNQDKVVHSFPDLPVPILGYRDFRWSQHGITLDLKTAHKLHGGIQTPHETQVALYIHKTNDQGRVCYGTPKKVAVYALEQPAAALDRMLAQARTLGRFLALSTDKHELAGLVCPDYESFYWNNPATRAAGMATFGY